MKVIIKYNNMWQSKYKSHATISTNWRRNRVVSYPYHIRMRIITSISYPLCNKRKQAIAIDIDVTDKMPFFIRPYQVKEEDKRVLDKEMKRLCYLGILKEGFSAYSSPVMLVSRKLTKDKRVITDFRHLNTRIAKNNIAYPLVKDTFTALGNSKCEVLSVLDLKDAFH